MQDEPLRGARWAVLALLLLLLWDASGLDLTLARAFGSTQGFALRDNVFLQRMLHDGMKGLALLLALALCLGVVWPIGPWRSLPFARRLQVVVSALLAWACVALLKTASHSSCPWDLQEFGGVARYLSHWRGWRQTDGGGGHCFPAGHATTGFAFIGGCFALRPQWPRSARTWLYGAMGTGLVLGVAQQLRGAHFMSHTLWTAWICWMVAWATDPWFARVTPVRVPEAAS